MNQGTSNITQNKIQSIRSVKDMLKWESDKNAKSVEQINASYLKPLDWEYTDVLYSFLGIYALGVYVYNKDLFETTEYFILKKGTTQRLYSLNFLQKIQNDDIYDLAFLNKDVLPFIEKYSLCGNVYPTWPGGNTHKGINTNGCFDIPELYFAKNYKWFEVLINMYKDTICLDQYINKTTLTLPQYSGLNAFLSSINTIKNYQDFIIRICNIIEERTEQIEKIATTIKNN